MNVYLKTSEQTEALDCLRNHKKLTNKLQNEIECVYAFDERRGKGSNYKCGGCCSLFNTICLLHKHLQTKEQATSYCFDILNKTAYPRFGSHFKSTQTESEVTLNSVHHAFKSCTVEKENSIDSSMLNFEDEIKETLKSIRIETSSTEDLDEMIRNLDSNDTDFQTIDRTEDNPILEILDDERQSNSDNKEEVFEVNTNLIATQIVTTPSASIVRISNNSSKSSRYINNKRCRQSKSLKHQSFKKMHQNKDKRHFNNSVITHDSKDFYSPGCGVALKEPHHKQESKRDHHCDVCGSHFASKGAARRHSLIHAGRLPYSCGECEKKYRTVAELNIHKTIHSDIKNKMCEFCGSLFRNSLLLRRHIKNCQDIRPFTCSMLDCGKSFKSKNSLLNHERDHTGETPYICEVCGCGFKRSDSLAKHRFTHTTKKPWVCDTCSKSFCRKYYLDRHALTHTEKLPFVCHCGKSFAQNWNLKAHMRQHTGEKPYQCDVCGAGFTHNVSKKRHMKLHRDGRSIPNIDFI